MMRAQLAEEEARALDAAGLLAEVRGLALERFPRERATLEIFFEELGRRLSGAAPDEDDEAPALPAGSFADLLTRLEELLEALLVGEAHGIRRR